MSFLILVAGKELVKKQLKEEEYVIGIVMVTFIARIQNREKYGLKKQINAIYMKRLYQKN